MKWLPWIGLVILALVLGLTLFHPSGWRVKAIQAGRYADSLQVELDSVRADASRIHQQNLTLYAKAATAESLLFAAYKNRKPIRQAVNDALVSLSHTTNVDSLFDHVLLPVSE